MPPTRNGTKRPREPLLQLSAESVHRMCRIGGRRRARGASPGGADVEIPPFRWMGSNPVQGTPLGGQFDWGGRLQKSNGGFPRYAQHEWQPCAECIGTSVLDWETDKSIRCESRAK